MSLSSNRCHLFYVFLPHFFQSQEEDTEEADKSEQQEEKKSIKLKKERLKGRQIKQQQEIGEQLIELRIQVQKIVSLMNQLPQVDVLNDVKTASASLDGEDVIKESSKAAKASLISLLGDIMGKITPHTCSHLTTRFRQISTCNHQLPTKNLVIIFWALKLDSRHFAVLL